MLPPSAQLHGFDIDVSQSPPQEWLSPNTTHRTWDAFSEVPDDMVEQYDVVHISIFMLLISKNDPSPLLKNLIKMLSRDHEHRHSLENGTDEFAKNQVAISSGTNWIGLVDVRWQ